MRDLTVRYGGLTAVDQASLRVDEGAIVGLIGPNGAGKSTLVDAVTGFTRYTGSTLLRGAPLDDLPPHHRQRRGLARTFQTLELFEELTVRQNLQVASRRRGKSAEDGDTSAVIDDVLDHLGLGVFADALPSELSLGRRKLVTVARALASRPSLLLLDEPAAGLDTSESRELADQLRGIVARGTSILLIDHDMSLVLDLCDRIYVLEFGRLIAEGTGDEVRRDPRVIAAYLGTETSE